MPLPLKNKAAYKNWKYCSRGCYSTASRYFPEMKNYKKVMRCVDKLLSRWGIKRIDLNVEIMTVVVKYQELRLKVKQQKRS